MQERCNNFKWERASFFITFSLFIELSVLDGAFGLVGRENPRPLSSGLPSLPFFSFSKSARRLRNSSGEVLFSRVKIVFAQIVNGW